jgi:hypothetical protein
MRTSATALALSLLGLAACSSDAGFEGDLPFAGDAVDLGKADVAGLASVPLDVDVASERRAKGGKAILTSAEAFATYLGTPAPEGFDFSRQWVAFYGAGVQSTGGYTASITAVRHAFIDGTLILATHFISPGPDCVVTQALTTPYAVVAFEVPTPRPLAALSDHTDEVRRCEQTNQERLADLAESRVSWQAASAANGNSYTYIRESASVFGSRTRTTLVVQAGVVVERRFAAQGGDGAPERAWTETGAEVGSNDEGAPPLLIDALYDQCENDVLTQDEEANFMTFRLDARNLLQVCTYFPKHCADDCSQGPTIASISF